ncbi:hypothetical protein [Pseudomarimonas salicorniae]|uniref:Lipid A 3-O-deacylase (PagL) n=1 Tax=Pseudomarimonas salicorniae TaxID=2933270 RepID=A0ABT0GHP8_9GAMM|nr:hypothetical protein [Lysobacter sp. CAU 1642]MCK7594071.1 hypothetical protein [Lysobacter sp. CAU 1642]
MTFPVASLFRCSLLGLATLTALPASAADEEAHMPWRASIGSSYSTVGNLAPFLGLHKPFARWRDYRIEAAVGVIGKHPKAESVDREHIGWVALGLARNFGRWEASFSVAASYPQTTALSSVGQFLTQVSYPLAEGYALRVGHMSNGSLHGRNRGETFFALTIDL